MKIIIKIILSLAFILRLGNSGTINKEGEISVSYPTSGEISHISFYFSLQNSLEEGEYFKIIWPRNFLWDQTSSWTYSIL